MALSSAFTLHLLIVKTFSLDKKKKIKGGPLFKSDKKEKGIFNELHSPIGVKHKHSVHGVVGPADYIFEQGSPPSNDVVSPVSTTEQVVVENQTINAPQAPPRPASASAQWATTQPTYQQPTTGFQKPLYSTESVPTFQPAFPTATTITTKIERPHSSIALVQERHLPPQSPTPFKQTQGNVTPQKPTLLSQAMNSGQFPQVSLFALSFYCILNMHG